MTVAQAAETRKVLAGLWEKSLPVVRERVGEMLRTAEAAACGELTAGGRESAGATAHKLAGSLGMFGYQQGTEIARMLELMLEGPGELDAKMLGELARELRSAVPL